MSGAVLTVTKKEATMAKSKPKHWSECKTRTDWEKFKIIDRMKSEGRLEECDVSEVYVWSLSLKELKNFHQ
jgi:hypothetical protein